MKDLAPQRETLADFEQKNRTSHVLQDRFTLVGHHQMLKETVEDGPRFLRYDFLLAIDSNRHWRTVRAGGRFSKPACWAESLLKCPH